MPASRAARSPASRSCSAATARAARPRSSGTRSCRSTPRRSPPRRRASRRFTIWRREALLEKLAAEYVFALLTEAAVESIASENAARFAAMESAHDNVSKKLGTVAAGRAPGATKSRSPTELLDLITGTEATQNATNRPSKNQFM